MMDQKQQIRSFVSNVIDNNYAAANKDLKAVVESKLKISIEKSTKKNLF
jgi:hypothetical protein